MTKSIFADFDYEQYDNLLASAVEDGVSIVHQNETFGGYTFVWKREANFRSSKMIRVSVSFCSPKDQFCRKIGTFNALHNWYEKGESIILPVGDEDSAIIVYNLRKFFYKAYECQDSAF